VIDQVGPAPRNVRFTHIFDRGADNHEVYCKLLLTQSDWVVRAAQLKRLIEPPQGKKRQLQKYLRGLPLSGRYELVLPPAPDSRRARPL